MKHKISSKDLFVNHLKNFEKSVLRLLYSYDVCNKISREYGNMSEEYLVQYEALTARYGRTIDILVNRVLRYMDILEYNESGTIVDITNNAEKRGFVSSAQELRVLKDLRNEIVHNYDSDDYEEVFDDTMELIPSLLEIINKVKAYSSRLLEKIT